MNTPKPQTGTWTLTAPDGRMWQADTPLKACGAEQRERVPPEVAMARIFAACDEAEAAIAQPAMLPINHAEAKSLAYIKRQESNLARCYLELCEPAQPVQPAKLVTCIWTEQDDVDMPGTYASACGELWSFIEGGVAENKIRFCHGCGKPVEAITAPKELS